MITLHIDKTTLWDEEKEEFITVNAQDIVLEHSLLSLSKWESKWEIPLLSKQPKSKEQFLDYIRCMTVTQHVNPYVYYCLTDEHIKTVDEYIDKKMSAATFSGDTRKGQGGKQVTADLIYYWLVALQIPFEPVEKWHLNRLMSLIKICNIENQPSKKMSRGATMRQNAALNAARRKRHGSRG